MGLALLRKTLDPGFRRDDNFEVSSSYNAILMPLEPENWKLIRCTCSGDLACQPYLGP